MILGRVGGRKAKDSKYLISKLEVMIIKTISTDIQRGI